MTDTPSDGNIGPKYWAAGGDLWTYVRHEGVKTLVTLTQTEIDDLLRWYADVPLSDDALSLRKAIDDRDAWCRVAYSH